MDEVVLRRVVGVLTLAIAAFLLSWLLPRPGLDRLRGEGERVVTVDLTRPDARPQELPPPSDATPSPAPTPSPPAKPASAPAAPEPDEPAATASASKPVESAGKTIAAAPAKPPESPRSVETPKPAAVPAKPVESKPVEPKPAAPKPTQPAAEAPAASPPSGGGSAGQVMVQAGAYSHLDKAEAVRERAGAQGQRCTISPAETAKGTLYRLRCGPYADRTQAQAAAKALTAAGIGAQVVGGGR